MNSRAAEPERVESQGPRGCEGLRHMAGKKSNKRALYYDPAAGEMKLRQTADPAVFEALNQRWTLSVLRALRCGPIRFNELAHQTKLNPNTLRERLRELEECGIVLRNELSKSPPHVEYRLTESGAKLGKIFAAFDQWSVRHAAVHPSAPASVR